MLRRTADLLAFFILLALGRLLDYLKIFPTGTDKSLNLYVIYIALPALILRKVPELDFSGDMLAPLLMPWLVVLFSGLTVLLLCRLLRWSRETTGALLLMVPLGNTAFLGVPMVERFFGADAVSYAVLYDQFGSFLILSSYGTFILALYSSGSKPAFLDVFRKVITFPPFVTLLVALLLRGIPLPDWLENLLSMTAESMTPVVMVSIGVQMRLLLPWDELSPLALGLFLRLLVTPLVFVGACRLLDLSGTPVHVALFETAMPPMVMASVLASVAGLKPQLSSAMAAYGILVAFFTLPVIYGVM
ncbi:MAG: AEC family transporter [Candidatus Electrothrix sp. AR4]|nr:AEC family transporter [Candidatus Electrothrix sp. AR4]